MDADPPELSTAEQEDLLREMGADRALRECWAAFLDSKFTKDRLTRRYVRCFLEAAREGLRYGFRGDGLLTHALTVAVNEIAAFQLLKGGGRRVSTELFRRSVRGEKVATRPAGNRYDRAGRPISEDRWLELFDDSAYRIVERTAVGIHLEQYDGRLVLCVVETVWVGVDQNARIEGSPLIYETEACTHVAGRIVHYASEAEAREGHAAMLRKLPPHRRLGNN